ncbi:hypothetical protein D8S82_23235 [Mycobacterium hodleri]|uniref:AbiEi antitoxin C-terminal domain-containing protein n=1 Tax=Mycolicibacterium hodleri TaxID=49897 RepID=A0A544VVU7_9MYCO|nr:hypothetical protein [Mycolicibacterium hodleri]TQR84116.1 hypothetical protein D8S82_23235 [Mycolicibacterium hodleri]
MEPFIGTEALARGDLTRGRLRHNYDRIHPDVYLASGQERTLLVNTEAAWLWTGRTGIVAGLAAAALHGVRTVDAATPIEMIGTHTRRRRGIVMREERIEADEVRSNGSWRVTTAARTALDLGRRFPRDLAVEYLDALARAADLVETDVAPLVERYRGARGIPQARSALAQMDGGTRCREETRIRLLLLDAGLPPPRTNITLCDGRDSTTIGMGWDEVKLGVSFFEPPRPGGCAAVQDLRHHELVERVGWTEIGFVAVTQGRSIVYRVRDELRRRMRGAQ